jgi:putative membrane protein insertion efficiency factor
MLKPMKKVNQWAVKMIESYQGHSKNTNPTCRFQPTCSHYAKEAFETRSFFLALGLSTWRVLRCNPLSKGGYDPVPKSRKEEK